MRCIKIAIAAVAIFFLTFVIGCGLKADPRPKDPPKQKSNSTETLLVKDFLSNYIYQGAAKQE